VVADRTLVTEVATALGTLPHSDLRSALASRSPVLRVDETMWSRLDHLLDEGAYRTEFQAAFENGRAFAVADDGLAGRPPRIVEWTGGRRPSGDEVAPIDLRIDHVYLISCKYLSANIANPSPARLIDGLLATTGSWDRTDWYQAVAPEEHQSLYASCRDAAGLDDLPESCAELTGDDRERLRRSLTARDYPPAARDAYRRLCAAVSTRSAERWSERLAAIDPERMVWRLLRIGNAPYFLLGAHGTTSVRLRIDTTWDWHHRYRCRELHVAPAHAGQPRVNWIARCTERAAGATRTVAGHVEIRWSHGRFGQPPEAKIYLDTPASEVPGYHPLEPSGNAGPGPAGGAGQGRFAFT
jgi:hypothetical protein